MITDKRYSIRYYLSERFRLRFEDSGLEEMMDENGEIHPDAAQAIANVSTLADEGIDVSNGEKGTAIPTAFMNGEIRTLDGKLAGDEFASDAINYQVLLQKIETLLEKLHLDA